MTLRNHLAVHALSAYLLVNLLAGCKPARNIVMEGDISGRWSGARWEGSARVLWLVERTADGRFEVVFHTCYSGAVVRVETQTGTSELSEGVYRTTIDRIVSDEEVWTADSERGPIVYEYEISELTPDSMRYQSVAYGDRYEVERVDDGFEMQCPPARNVVNTSPGGRRGQDAWIRRGIGEDKDEPAETPDAESAD